MLYRCVPGRHDSFGDLRISFPIGMATLKVSSVSVGLQGPDRSCRNGQTGFRMLTPVPSTGLICVLRRCCMRTAHPPFRLRTERRMYRVSRLQQGLEKGIDERCYGTAASEHDQQSQQEQHDNDRRQPEFLSLLHEKPQVIQKIHKAYIRVKQNSCSV